MKTIRKNLLQILVVSFAIITFLHLYEGGVMVLMQIANVTLLIFYIVKYWKLKKNLIFLSLFLGIALIQQNEIEYIASGTLIFITGLVMLEIGKPPGTEPSENGNYDD